MIIVDASNVLMWWYFFNFSFKKVKLDRLNLGEFNFQFYIVWLILTDWKVIVMLGLFVLSILAHMVVTLYFAVLEGFVMIKHT